MKNSLYLPAAGDCKIKYAVKFSLLGAGGIMAVALLHLRPDSLDSLWQCLWNAACVLCTLTFRTENKGGQFYFCKFLWFHSFTQKIPQVDAKQIADISH